MNYHKILALLFVSISVLSCETEEEDINNPEISDRPLSGTLYGTSFTAFSGRADEDVVFGVESLVVQISSDDLGCETGQFSGAFPIRITIPRAVGTHESNVFVTFSDPNSSDFVSVSGGIIAQVISLTPTNVLFKIKAESLGSDNSIEGAHGVRICQ